jgi:hypothetical protein
VADETNGNGGCNPRRALGDIAAGAIVKVTDTQTKAKVTYIVAVGFVAAIIYAMYIGGQVGDIAFVERALFIFATAATTTVSTFMGVNAALSRAGQNGNGAKP